MNVCEVNRSSELKTCINIQSALNHVRICQCGSVLLSLMMHSIVCLTRFVCIVCVMFYSWEWKYLVWLIVPSIAMPVG